MIVLIVWSPNVGDCSETCVIIRSIISYNFIQGIEIHSNQIEIDIEADSDRT